MSFVKSNTAMPGSAIWIALVLFVVALGGGVTLLTTSEMRVEHKLTLFQLVVSMLGFGGAIAAFVFAVVQYRRSEQWKRAEFIANEIKDFESDPTVQNALLMIDWGNRRVNLFQVPNPTVKDFVKITREVQWKALLPHPVKNENLTEYRMAQPTSHDAQSNGDQATFTFVEARIRDTYDVFLTHLDQFANFIKSGVISAEELEPFIRYWIEALTSNNNPSQDAAWKSALLTYINFYDYSGVKYLLKLYGKDVEPESRIYNDVLRSVDDRDLAERLFQSLRSREVSVVQAL